MKKFIGFIFVILAGFHSTCFAEIIQTNDTKVIEKILASIDTDTLVIFDVDEVLLQYFDHKNRVREKIKKISCSQQDEADLYWSIISRDQKVTLVDEKFPALIQNLQSRGIRVCALTQCNTGAFGVIKSMATWRIQALLEKGIDFKKSWPSIEDRVNFGGYERARFQEGVIFASDYQKGEILKAFLNQINIHPKRIVFIDDNLENLQSVENCAKEKNIKFVGFEYNVVKNRPIQPLNEEREKLKFDVLKKEKKWISDSEADAQLHKRIID
jgi:hypothetical protein